MKGKAIWKKLTVFLLTAAMTLTLNITVSAESGEETEGDSVQCKKNAECVLEDGHEGDCTVEADDNTEDTFTDENIKKTVDDSVVVSDVNGDGEIQLMSVDDGYTEWTDSTSLPSRGVYKLTTDVTLAAEVTVGNTLVLDLNGHTITAADGKAFFIQTNGGVTIEDSAGGGKITNSGVASSMKTLVQVNSGAFYMTGGTLENVTTMGYALFYNGTAVGTISGGEIINSGSSAYALYTNSSSNVTVSGGKIINSGNSAYALYTNSSSNVTVSGGVIKNTVNGGDAVYVNGGLYTQTGGTVIQEGTYSSDAAIQVNRNVPEVIISGGEVISSAIGIYAEKTTVTVTGGSIDAAAYAFQTRNTVIQPSEGNTVTVKSGNAVFYTFSGADNKVYGGDFTAPQVVKVYTTDNTEPKVTITGGTFSENNNEEIQKYVSAGLNVKQDENGKFIITRAEIIYLNGKNGDDTKTGVDETNAVKTLDKALELVAENGTIVVCGTVTLDNAGPVNLSNITLKRAESLTDDRFMNVMGNTQLTLSHVIMDGADIEIDPEEDAEFIALFTGATLNVEEGTELINNKSTAVSVFDNSTLNMNGGSIKNNSSEFDGGAIYVICGTVNLKGGVIEGNTSEVCGGAICNLSGIVTLDGTEIKNNAAASGGGGIYLQGDEEDGPASFNMISGSIIGNTVTEDGFDGGAIRAWYGGDDTVITISGGVIKDNTTKDGPGTAIGLDKARDVDGYPQMKLSGSPEISGDVFMYDDEEAGPVIEVIGAFAPVNPVTLIGNYGEEGTTVVKYDTALTPDVNQFASGYEPSGLVVNGQTLEWKDKISVPFKSGDNQTTYKRLYVLPNSKIAPADAPIPPAKTGYTFSAWRVYGTGDIWDFENDMVTEDTPGTLLASWTLNAPTVSLEADKETVHTGSEIVLTAKASHDLGDAVTYTYKWYKDGELIDNADKATLVVDESGVYTVKVTADDGILPVPSEAGEGQITCTVEGHVLEWKSDETKHWQECSGCDEKTDAAEHTFGDWTVTKAATATEAGSKEKVCTVCGYKVTESIPAAGETDEPDTPNKPTTPDKPNTPDKPATPDKPSTPDKPGNTNKPTNANKPANTSKPATASSTPKTGDENHLGMWIMLLGLSAAGIAVTLTVTLKRKRKVES